MKRPTVSKETFSEASEIDLLITRLESFLPICDPNTAGAVSVHIGLGKDEKTFDFYTSVRSDADIKRLGAKLLHQIERKIGDAVKDALEECIELLKRESPIEITK